MRRVTGRPLALALSLFGVLSPSAYAQLAVPGAAEGKLTLLESATSVYLDVAQSKLGLYISANPVQAQDPEACGDPDSDGFGPCIAEQFQRRLEGEGRLYFDATAAISAKEGRRALFSGGDLVPGLELAGTANLYQELPRGYVHLFGGGQGSWTLVNVAATEAGVVQLGTDDSRSLGYTLGANWFTTERMGLGVSHAGDYLWNSTRFLDADEVCVVHRTGTDADGRPVTASRCSSRYEGPLVDEFVTRTGVGLVAGLPNLGRVPLSLTAEGAVVTREGLDPSFNVSIGPVVHPIGRPRHTLLAVIFGFEDVTDANDRSRDFEDVFSVQLFLGIPLPQ